jgi:hypothetical protein
MEQTNIHAINQNPLFAPGVFRDYQIIAHKTKAETIEKYRQWIKMDKTEYIDQDTVNQTCLRHLRRHYNINLIKYRFDIEPDFIAAKKLGRQKKMKIVNAAAWNINYADIENWCFNEGKECDIDTIEEAYYELIND